VNFVLKLGKGSGISKVKGLKIINYLLTSSHCPENIPHEKGREERENE